MKKLFEKFFKKKKKYTSFDNEDKDTLSHYQILKLIHNCFNPKTYLEIGVQQGRSINLTNIKTLAIGIDPFKDDDIVFNKNIKMFHIESDDFFKNYDVCKKFENKKIDVALIDGMHLFDFVLRDKISSERINSNGAWTGDVYKIIPILKKYRPDLKIYNISIPPIGVCLVYNLNPDSDILEKNYDNIYQEYINMTYDDIKDNLEEKLSILSLNLQDIKNLLEQELKISF